MQKTQLWLVVGGLALILVLFQLPRVVVENEKVGMEPAPSHDLNIPADIRLAISDLRRSWSSEADIQKKLNFADSLASLYLDFQMLDSAVWYVDQIKSMGSEGRELRIADLYFWAFQRTSDAAQAKEFGAKAEAELRKLTEQNPTNSSLKNRLAMTLVATENPMQGIQMLREILAEKPGDPETLKNLGILSLQSGQFDKAEERFRELLAADSSDLEVLFYLGMSLIEQEKPEGRQIMETLATSDVNTAIKSLATEYLEN
jgi:cytochrome c-type biogenesis protein CcmH/NrfG